LDRAEGLKMSGKKGRSGRKPAPKTLIDRMLAVSEPHLPEIQQALVDLALGVKIGETNENGQSVNVYAKPPDKEAAAEILNRHFGKPRIELDQRMKSEVDMTLDPSRLIQAMRELETNRADFLQLPERQLSGPTREQSHDPVSEVDITAPCERDVAER
jgi:DNA-binding cell septation regulator SpoVG